MNNFVFCVPKSLEENARTKTLKKQFLENGYNPGIIIKAYAFELSDQTEKNDVSPEFFISESCIDPLLYDVIQTDSYKKAGIAASIIVAKNPGVTDDVAKNAEKCYLDRYNSKAPNIFVHEIYFLEQSIANETLEKLAYRLIANPLIHRVKTFQKIIKTPFFSQSNSPSAPLTKIVPVPESTTKRIELSEKSSWALNNVEMDAIAAYFSNPATLEKRKLRKLSDPSDCEWEIFAQTWSEHCKHKEFNAHITIKNIDTGKTRVVDSIFKSRIKASTDFIHKSLNEKSFLVKVFNDNAGVVRLGKDKLFVWKVETHNTPSALDPYGGAITGILGNNRDAMGTGIGGAKTLFNTNVLCFGPKNYQKPLQKNQWHPLYIQEGVVAGIKDGGNQSGIPTVNGSVIYDERYAGKPLVFCGTGAIMPERFAGKLSWEKPIAAGDLIFMAGGGVGRDGIHGATASSLEDTTNTPGTIVQLGSSMTQKFLYDFLREAVQKGLIKCSTDNGAGGLSSSIGELAEITNGAEVQLEKVPLKTQGLAPWEIFLSESQERMTLVCEPHKAQELCELAKNYEVSCTAIGSFNNSGLLEVFFKEECIASLELNFLHHGVPKKRLEGEWQLPKLVEPSIPQNINYSAVLLELLASPQICSRRSIISQYDHEVKAKTIIKPLMGKNQCAPQDAAVVRLDFDSFQGIAVSNGICPKYGDIDPYAMSAGAFDEAVRQCVAVGARLPNYCPLTKNPWSVNDNFCLPNVVYHPTNNPDGKEKLAKLVFMADALYDMATHYMIPMTSGKDSMKNDFGHGADKISIPPTVLYSMAANIYDVRDTITSEWKKPKHLIYLVGITFNELGASEFYRLFGELGANVPVVRKDMALKIYNKLNACHDKKIIKSTHDLSDGGLAVALAESSIGSGLGIDITLPKKDLSIEAALFSESHSRFIVSIDEYDKNIFEKTMDRYLSFLGHVREDKEFIIRSNDTTVIKNNVDELHKFWENDCV